MNPARFGIIGCGADPSTCPDGHVESLTKAEALNQFYAKTLLFSRNNVNDVTDPNPW